MSARPPWLRLGSFRWTLTLGALLAVMVAAWWLLAPYPEPNHRGRPLMEWARDLKDPDPAVSQRARQAFEAMGPDAIMALAERLTRADTPAARAYLRADARVKEPLRGFARRLLQPYARAADRHAAANALSVLGTNALPALPALLVGLRDPSPHVVHAAALTLANLGPVATPGLIAALGDAHATTRSFAAIGLGRLGPAAADAAPALVSGLSDPNLDVRSECANALNHIGPAAIPHLRRALHAADARTRVAAVPALASFRRRALDALPDLAALLADPDPIVRQKAAEAFPLVWGITPQSMAALHAGQSSTHEAARNRSQRALVQLNAQAAPVMEVLRPLLQHEDPSVRAAAGTAIATLGPAAQAAPSAPDAASPPFSR